MWIVQPPSARDKHFAGYAFQRVYVQSLTGLGALAPLLDSQEKYAEAEPLYRRALAIWEAASAADGLPHDDATIALGNLAANLQAQRRTAEAEEMYRKALPVRSPPAVLHCDVIE